MTCSSGFVRIVSATTMLLVVLTAVASDQGERVIVVSVTGDWKQQGARLSFGQSLAATGCLFGSDGSVVLQPDKNDASAQLFLCEKPTRDASCTGHDNERCAVPLDPAKWKSGPGSPGSLGNLWSAIRKLFTGDPEKYMVAASRGLEPELVDAVVLLNDHKTDLAPAFRKMPAAQYWVKLTPVNSSAPPSGVLALQFATHQAAIVSLPAAQQGLYRLSLADQAGAPAGSDCWILLSAPPSFSSASETFQRAVENSSHWPEDMDPSAVRALLRAYLESLSISEAPHKP